jgi:hypothetical protein
MLGPRPGPAFCQPGTLGCVGGHESWVERQIREAQERGEFDNLPGAGKPLPPYKGQDDENWWIRGLVERERLDMTAALPPQLALRKEAQTLPDRVMAERTEQGVRDAVEDFNARVRELWRRPLDGPLVVVRTLDAERLVARWRAQREPVQPVAAPRGAHEQPRRRRGHPVRRVLDRVRRTR